MDANTLRSLADLNFAESIREHARTCRPSRIEERDGLLLARCGSRFPAGPFNCVVALDDNVPSDERLREATAWFTAEGRGFSIYGNTNAKDGLERACERAGLRPLSSAPVMVLERAIGRARPPAQATVRLVQSAEDARALIEVCASSYAPRGLPADVTRKLLADHAFRHSPQFRSAVLFEGGQACASAMLFFSHGIAGIYWVGTVPEARRRGYAEVVTREVSELAFEHGAKAVILQASEEGDPVYRRIGFREIGRYPFFVVPKTR